MWKWINILLVMLVMALVIVAWQVPKQRLEIVFCDVGQGDATLVTWGKYQMLVDGGPQAAVLSCLGKNMAFWDRKIEILVVTHPQADHMTGMIEVVRRYKVGQIAMSKVENDTPEVRELKRVIGERQVKWVELVAGDAFKLGEVNLEVLYPFNKGSSFVKGVSDINEVSTVLMGSYGESGKEFDFLLTGDIGEGIEEQLRLTNKLQQVEVLKVAHHGSKYSSGAKFLEAVKPKLAVISVGKNRFGHPTSEVLDRLEQARAKVMTTMENGAIKVISAGQKWWVKQ